MKGVIVEKVGAPAVVVDNIEKPKPADDQVLVKSIYAALNPVYNIPPNFNRFTNLTVIGMGTWPELAFLSSNGHLS
jgi:hypothetical protein